MNNDNNIKNDVNVLQDEGCPAVFHRNVCVQGTVTITPNIETGEIQSTCVGDPMIGGCDGELVESCSFTVSQNICVQVPLEFSAAASVEPNGLVCEEPEIGECPGVVTECTHTIGYYRNNTEVTNQLIEDAGGSIVLGTEGVGASFTVTTDNVNDVLDFNTPSPPAPSDPPFAAQYQNLYAQLLVSNLNMISGAVCDFAVDAIDAANIFIADSIAGVGMAGAPALQEVLELYNSGNVPSCPEACDEEESSSCPEEE